MYFCQTLKFVVMNKPLSKEELINRLKAIAADNTPRIENPGAMCYSPMVPSQEHFSCEICGGDSLRSTQCVCGNARSGGA